MIAAQMLMLIPSGPLAQNPLWCLILFFIICWSVHLKSKRIFVRREQRGNVSCATNHGRGHANSFFEIYFSGPVEDIRDSGSSSMHLKQASLEPRARRAQQKILK
jgi:hypothetical protein